jgi:hypothetical protein
MKYQRVVPTCCGGMLGTAIYPNFQGCVKTRRSFHTMAIWACFRGLRSIRRRKVAKNFRLRDRSHFFADFSHGLFRECYARVMATDRQIETDERDWLHYLDRQGGGAKTKTFKELKPDLVAHRTALTDVKICAGHAKEVRIENAIILQTATGQAREHDALAGYPQKEFAALIKRPGISAVNRPAAV